MNDFRITLKKRKGDLRYTVKWSPYFQMDKYLIRNLVPSEAGIFQIFKKDGHGLLMIISDYAYYGGIRGTIRELIDPLSPRDYPFRDVMMSEECYCRFSLNPHLKDLQNVVAFMNNGEAELEEGDEIFVNEVNSNQIKRVEEEKAAPVRERDHENFFVGAEQKNPQ